MSPLMVSSCLHCHFACYSTSLDCGTATAREMANLPGLKISVQCHIRVEQISIRFNVSLKFCHEIEDFEELQIYIFELSG